MSILVKCSDRYQIKDQKQLKGLLTKIKKALSGRVQKAFVFGSCAKKSFKTNSDIDLIIVLETDLPFVSRPSLFDDLWDIYPDIDLLVYTPEELDKLLNDDNAVGFWKSVKCNIKQLL